MILLFGLIKDREVALAGKHEKIEALKDALDDGSDDQAEEAELLDSLGEKQEEIEDELIDAIFHPKLMNRFLAKIILVENLFNNLYNASFRNQQQSARAQYAPTITKYENAKVKCRSKASSFGGLYLAAQRNESNFNDNYVSKVVALCNQNGIQLKNKPSANLKKPARSFYKAYFWYNGDDSFTKLTDLLRCTLVFYSFDDLYRAFTVIEAFSAQKGIGGILRVKDRFNANKMPFGYRDCLLNVRCPGTKIVCEVQLHHYLFYDNKKDSHKIYKTARIFDMRPNKSQPKVKKVNWAYNAAIRFQKDRVGSRSYDDNDRFTDKELQKQVDNEDGDDELDEALEQAFDAIESGQLTTEEIISALLSGDFVAEDYYDDDDIDSDWDDEYDDYESEDDDDEKSDD